MPDTKTITFTATSLGREYVFNVLTVGLANDQGEYVSFQRYLSEAREEDEGVQFEYRDQLYCGMRIIDKVLISSNRVLVMLDKPLHPSLIATKFDMHLDLDETSLSELRESLVTIFVRQPELLIEEAEQGGGADAEPAV